VLANTSQAGVVIAVGSQVVMISEHTTSFHAFAEDCLMW